MNKMLKKLYLLAMAIFVLLVSGGLPIASSFAAETEVEHENEEEHEELIEMDDELASELGIEVGSAGSGVIVESELLYGKTVLDPQQVSHVSARYPGMIKNIVPALGDEVTEGQIIATIEANESLRVYEVQAPIDGVVIEKHANPGELAGNDSLLTIANYNNIWVDLIVFPALARQIRPGMPVTIMMDDLEAQSSISYLNPTDGQSPVVIARIPLSNPDLNWTPGLLVEGYVQVALTEAMLVIDNKALQTYEEQNVVFVKDGEQYEPRVVTLGRTDGKVSEVLSGLTSGELYVIENSYLLKADLEKDGVEHGH